MKPIYYENLTNIDLSFYCFTSSLYLELNGSRPTALKLFFLLFSLFKRFNKFLEKIFKPIENLPTPTLTSTCPIAAPSPFKIRRKLPATNSLSQWLDRKLIISFHFYASILSLAGHTQLEVSFNFLILPSLPSPNNVMLSSSYLTSFFFFFGGSIIFLNSFYFLSSLSPFKFHFPLLWKNNLSIKNWKRGRNACKTWNHER